MDFPNLHHLFFSQFAHAVLLAFCVSALTGSVLNVLTISPQKQMSRVDANRVIAGVAYAQFVRQDSVCQKVSHSMRSELVDDVVGSASDAKLDLPVIFTVVEYEGKPRPALIWLSYFCLSPEPCAVFLRACRSFEQLVFLLGSTEIHQVFPTQTRRLFVVRL